MHNCGAVIIGRNEGERLVRCIQSVGASSRPTVYVDSGSADGSVNAARSLGAMVVELDRALPFSAARARNEGLEALRCEWPGVQYVQFVDGDCEIAERWIETAVRALEERGDVAAVAGRLRERFPEASIYNRLCDAEWNSEVGEVKACGGISMFRVAPFVAAGGFNPNITAGEEPELCVRLRQNGWKILRLAEPMGWHDAAMMRFGQWWRRMIRGGYAYAQGAALHGNRPERHNVRQLRSAAVWGMAVPLMCAAALVGGAFNAKALLALAIPLGLLLLLVLKVFRYRMRMGDPMRTALLYALFIPPAKVAQCIGAASFFLGRLRGRGPRLIEYKAAPAAAGGARAGLAEGRVR